MQITATVSFPILFISLNATTGLKFKTIRESCRFFLNMDRGHYLTIHTVGCMEYHIFFLAIDNQCIKRPKLHSDLLLHPNDQCLPFFNHTPKCFVCIATILQKNRKLASSRQFDTNLHLSFLLLFLPLSRHFRPPSIVTSSLCQPHFLYVQSNNYYCYLIALFSPLLSSTPLFTLLFFSCLFILQNIAVYQIKTILIHIKARLTFQRGLKSLPLLYCLPFFSFAAC